MTTVQNHIKELLFEQDCVVIPDFGGFVTNFDCAKIDNTNRLVTPPQKWLAFNSLLKNDDGLLSNYIAKNENISREQASQKIKAFVEETKWLIRSEKAYTMSGLGTFSQNEENKIQFQPKDSNNFYSESYGMETICLKKAESFKNELHILQTNSTISNTTIQQVFVNSDREPMAEVLVEEKKYLKRKGLFSRVLPIVYGLVGSAIIFSAIYLFDNPKANLSSLNPFQTQGIKNSEISEHTTTVEKVIPSVPVVNENLNEKPVEKTNTKPATESIKTVVGLQKSYFVITGSFGSKTNAQKLLKTLKSKGFDDASLLLPRHHEKLIKVSAGGFTNEAEANSEAEKVKDAINQSTWIFKK